MSVVIRLGKPANEARAKSIARTIRPSNPTCLLEFHNMSKRDYVSEFTAFIVCILMETKRRSCPIERLEVARSTAFYNQLYERNKSSDLLNYGDEK